MIAPPCSTPVSGLPTSFASYGSRNIASPRSISSSSHAERLVVRDAVGEAARGLEAELLLGRASLILARCRRCWPCASRLGRDWDAARAAARPVDAALVARARSRPSIAARITPRRRRRRRVGRADRQAYHAAARQARAADGRRLGAGRALGPRRSPAAAPRVIRHVLPRRSLLVRKAAGEATAPQPLAANVDVGIVLTSANSDLSPARLDRYLGLLRDGGIAPRARAVEDRSRRGSDGAARARSRGRAGAPVVARRRPSTGAGLARAPRARPAAGQTAVLLGSSGVGKSSLLNALVGDAVAAHPRDPRRRARPAHDDAPRAVRRPTTACGSTRPACASSPSGSMRRPGRRSTTSRRSPRTASSATAAPRPSRAAPSAGQVPPERLASFHKLRPSARVGRPQAASGAAPRGDAQGEGEEVRAAGSPYE